MAGDRDTGQLKLLEIPPFTGGPARLPKAPKAIRVGASTLPLPFESSVSTRPPLPEPVRRGPDPQAASVPSSTDRNVPRDPLPRRPGTFRPAPRPEVERVPEERVFVWPAKPTTEAREQLLTALAAALKGQVRRGGACEVRGPGAVMTIRADVKVVQAVLLGADPLGWWRSLQDLAREHGLVEVD